MPELENTPDLMSIQEASQWASEYLKRNVTPSNISYLIQYGRIKRHQNNGDTKVSSKELVEYYHSYFGNRELKWKEQLGNDVNWALSFDYLKEADTTKHVHRLHPYKGKFIPQLVEYFLDEHTDEFKTETYFKTGDVVLDPFAGSGTMLVQANELGINAIGIDISEFNTLITNTKLGCHDLKSIKQQVDAISKKLQAFLQTLEVWMFDAELSEKLSEFNEKYFPSPEFKRKVISKTIDQNTYGQEKESAFLTTYWQMVNRYSLTIFQNTNGRFIDKWYLLPVRREIDFILNEIEQVEDVAVKKVLQIILSRTVRSCRATTHRDLATLKEPVRAPYYCAKHGKICKPLFTMINWWKRYSTDTLNRLEKFNQLKTNTDQICLIGDSRELDILNSLKEQQVNLFRLVKEKGINGIFSSPPYVGLIDYHEQHAYAYDIFNFKRRDENEIGPLYKGQGVEARNAYVKSIGNVLLNCRKYMCDDFNIFLVANDKYSLYPRIAELAEMRINKVFKRPVINRSEASKNAYSESIFHLKDKNQ